MGNDTSTVLSRTISQKNRYVEPHNSIYKNYPDPNNLGHTFSLATFLHHWKYSQSEFQYYTYRFLLGSIYGGIIGICILNPMFRASPYVTRKFVMQYKSNEFFPIELARMGLKGFTLKYSIYGGIIGVSLQFFSDFYDRFFDTNRVTKYLTLGAFNGYFVGTILGWRYGWFYGMMTGFITGVIGSGFYETMNARVKGIKNLPPQYFDHVTEDEKRKHKLQEARIIGVPANFKQQQRLKEAIV